jgi:shikimate dehydrogenase
MNISGNTKVIAIFGDPIKHTPSPAMHNAAFAEMGIDYIRTITSSPMNWARQHGLKALGFAGANITVPHKERVLEFLDEVDPFAGKLGAVNTIVNRDGRLTGYNTDGLGFIKSLKEDAGFDPAKKKAFICGSGGAARAIGFALENAGARRVYLYDIDEPKRDRLVTDINSASGKVSARPSPLDADQKLRLR